VLEAYGKGEGHIFNLGHGILPDINPEHAKVLVDFVKEESAAYHLKDNKKIIAS
jgi:uroporphyrinogen decarboxylase